MGNRCPPLGKQLFAYCYSSTLGTQFPLRRRRDVFHRQRVCPRPRERRHGVLQGTVFCEIWVNVAYLYAVWGLIPLDEWNV